MDRPQDSLDVYVARPRRDVLGAGDVAHHRRARRRRSGEQPDEISVAGRQLGDDPGGEHGHVALGARGVGKRRHRPAGVDDERDGVLASRHEPLDERPPAACRRLPVEILDVVAEHVLAQVIEVHAAALVDRAVLTVEHAAHLAVGAHRRLRLDLAQE